MTKKKKKKINHKILRIQKKATDEENKKKTGKSDWSVIIENQSPNQISIIM